MADERKISIIEGQNKQTPKSELKVRVSKMEEVEETTSLSFVEQQIQAVSSDITGLEYAIKMKKKEIERLSGLKYEIEKTIK